MSRIAGFLAVGAVGFVVDAAILWLLLDLTSIGPFAARLVSVGTALATTWLLNRRFTFGPSRRSLAAEGTRYGGVSMATSAANYLVYSALLMAFPAFPPLLALALSLIHISEPTRPY